MQTPPGDSLRPSPSFFCMILSLCEDLESHHSIVEPAGSNAEPSSLVSATNTVFASPTCMLKFWLRTVMPRLSASPLRLPPTGRDASERHQQPTSAPATSSLPGWDDVWNRPSTAAKTTAQDSMTRSGNGTRQTGRHPPTIRLSALTVIAPLLADHAG